MLAGAGLLACVVGLVAWTWADLQPLSLARAEALSVTVLDRNDRLLRAYTTPDGRWRLPVEVKDVDPRYLAMLIAFEDKRFRRHHGVDPLAVGRAGWLLVRHRRIVSGGSTSPCRWRGCCWASTSTSLAGKIRQALLRAAARAAAVEGRDPARSICGWRRSAATSKACARPRSPISARSRGGCRWAKRPCWSPFRSRPRCAVRIAFPKRRKRARNHVLARMLAAGVISREDAARAMAERMPTARREFPDAGAASGRRRGRAAQDAAPCIA